MGSIKCPVLPDNITEQLIDNIDPESHCLNMYKYIEYNEKTLSYDNRPLLEVGQSPKKESENRETTNYFFFSRAARKRNWVVQYGSLCRRMKNRPTCQTSL